MSMFFTGLFVLYGSIFGSFYNVVGLRVPEKKSIVSPGSACPKCGHRLKWSELIPVLSYFLLKGKCKSCGLKIPVVYPVIEAATGLLFGLSFYIFGFSGELIISLIFVSLLITVTVSDIEYMIIPDRILLFFGAILIPLRIFVPLNPWWDAILGAAAGFVLLLLIAIVSRGGMGGGDIKLYAVIGLVLGVKLTLLSFFIATFIGTAAGLIAIYVKKKSRKEPIPFGPSIAAGALIAYFWGDQLINAYLSVFF
ncbi:prepilin peptidase [Jeotgalibacillus terrae]|uniref:Prepilin peptidase n=1 Tax=Jeotgalibacillus terrae TaxID=587735 RepID=A0ABW5ZKD0_9BACL|nr:A24 family peptidase [Jeotgalibacillus terrae]MBM7578833.1 leader peptidase (prepilin peptidase)/N-methyltransferase [Jeotgalibacillus terrae]